MVDPKQEHAKVIDFDWAGKSGTARYPLTINKAALSHEWHRDVEAGGLMETDHDAFAHSVLSHGCAASPRSMFSPTTLSMAPKCQYCRPCVLGLIVPFSFPPSRPCTLASCLSPSVLHLRAKRRSLIQGVSGLSAWPSSVPSLHSCSSARTAREDRGRESRRKPFNTPIYSCVPTGVHIYPPHA
jgi:hypothetical protein